MRNPDHTWPVPSWAQARDCETLHGREWAEKVWGTGYYRDDGKQADMTSAISAHIENLERQVNFLYANRTATHKEDKVIWKPSDGLAAREV